MNRIETRPMTRWITVGLLTVLLMGFGMFANNHIAADVVDSTTTQEIEAWNHEWVKLPVKGEPSA